MYRIYIQAKPRLFFTDIKFGFMVLDIPIFYIATALNKPTYSMYSVVRDGAVSAEVREGRASQSILWTQNSMHYISCDAFQTLHL